MGTNPTSGITDQGVGDLLQVAQQVISQANALVKQTNPAASKDLYKIRCLGAAQEKMAAGMSKVETRYHTAMEEGRFLNRSLGDALSDLQHGQLELLDKIIHFLHLNKLAIHGQLSDKPRAAKFVKDSINIVRQIRSYVSQIYSLVAALQANIVMLNAMEMQMAGMIQDNMNSLANLLNEICNWGLPDLLSMAALFGGLFHFNGFNFNPAAGFSLNPSLTFGFDFSFAQCLVRQPDYTLAFTSAGTLQDGPLTYSNVPGTLPLQGTLADPTLLTDPTYIGQMQSTTTPVYNQLPPTITSSLPPASSIISDYSLPPDQYQQNVISTIPELAPLVMQLSDADYNTGPSASRVSSQQALFATFVTLGHITESNYDPNLTAAWLLYLDANRTLRRGTWISGFEQEYQAHIAPSVAYVKSTPVPYNNMLGGPGPTDTPPAIPLIATLQADTANNLHWRLSFIEAALLGYSRNRTWDSAADNVYTAGFTGSALDYEATAISTNTSNVVVGADTAAYPVSITYPQSIGSVLTKVIAQAAGDILVNPSYQSSRPQFRFTYDMFAQAKLVDRFSQFWREFNANLQSLLAGDPYVVGFLVSYPQALNGAINPLADQTAYNAVQADATSRNRLWKPGMALLPIPKAINMNSIPAGPEAGGSGWSNGAFRPSTFLARPDIQALPIPVQMAMLNVNEGYAALLSTRDKVQTAVQTAIASANASIQSSSVTGWEVESNSDVAIPPGAAGMTMSFSTIDFDYTSFVQDNRTINIQSAATYIITGSSSWVDNEQAGTRTLMLLHNDTVVATASTDASSPDPYTVQFSALLTLNAGDLLRVQAMHSLSTSQLIESGATFLGLADPTSSAVDTAILPNVGPSTVAGITTYLSGTALPATATAVRLSTDGAVYTIDPTVTAPGVTPFLDGVALQSVPFAGMSVQVAQTYGSIFTTTGTSWITGGLLYVAADGSLTQDYATLVTKVRWVICVGRAVSATSFLYEPQLPMNFVRKF